MWRRPWMKLFRWIDGIAPAPALRTPESALKVHFFVRAWVFTIAFASAMAVSFAFEGLSGQAILNASMAVMGVVVLLLLRAGVDANPLVLASLGLPQVAVAFGAVAQTPFDLSTIFFLSVFPLLASMMGTRWALLFLIESLLLGFVALALGLTGHTLRQVDPHPTMTTVTNFAFVTVMTALGGMGVHELRRKAIEAVDSASRAKSALLASVSHDIRTPMNGVLGLTEVMLTEPLPAHQRERLLLIQRSGEVLVSLINDLLDLSRIEAGKLPIAPVDTDLPRLLSDVGELFRAPAEEKGLAMVLALPPGLPLAVKVDQLRLRQVLSNLVSNAVKFTDHGEVRVAVSQEPSGRFRFEVADTGLGLSLDQQGRLFESFHQAHHPSAARGGSGLGLALSRQLVGLMGGTLQVASRPQEGSRFYFELSLPPGTLPTVTPTAPPRPSTGLRVLVVDDNPINLKVAQGLAEKAGCRVTIASDGARAVALVTQEPFDIVLMDCQMPGVDGFEATRRIRGLSGPRGATRVVALTASALPEDVAACVAAGMDDFLAKPVSMARLVEVLERWRPPRTSDARVGS